MSIVTISELKNSVLCSTDGKAEHVFSIENSGTSSLKIGVQLLIDSPTKEAWLDIVDVPKSYLDVGTVTQISVKIAVPKNGEAKNYSYRIRIFDPKSPGQRFTESNTVYFTVPKKESTASVIEKKCKWCIPAAISATLIITAGVTTWFLIPSKVTVPDFTNMTFNNAIMALSKNQLSFDDSKNLKKEVNENQIGKVIRQEPKADANVAKGTFITLWVGGSKQLTALEVQLNKKVKELQSNLSNYKKQIQQQNIRSNQQQIEIAKFQRGKQQICSQQGNVFFNIQSSGFCRR